MCIAILTLPGKKLSQQVFDRCFESNRDGAGFAYIDPFDKEVKIDKGWMGKLGAFNRYSELATKFGKDFPMLIHMRIATVGTVEQDNCHPFQVKGGAMMHNGTFWHDMNTRKSDTRQLAEVMHNELTYDNVSTHKEHFAKAFGANRVAFLFKEGKYVIINETYENKRGNYGQWHDGIWFSNGGWKERYSGYYGEDESTQEIADLDDSLWGYPYRGQM